MGSGKKWYMIKHNKCEAVFTLDQVTFNNSFVSDSWERKKEIICPNCGQVVMNSEKVDSLLNIFKEDVKLSKHVTVTELKEEDFRDELTTKIIKAIKGN